MSGSDEIEDVAALRAALAQAREEAAAARAGREALERAHQDALARVRQESSKEVVMAALRAEAIRLGAHNPDDVVRLIDTAGVSRAEDGTVVGAAEVLERARQERSYLFGDPVRPGAASGTTVGHPAPRPGGAEPFDARSASAADYRARKGQFLAGA